MVMKKELENQNIKSKGRVIIKKNFEKESSKA
jgi:hypothetical protein